MNRQEAEDFYYKSYLRAQKHQSYSDKDSKKRHPELTKSVIEARKKTPCVLVTGSKGKGSVAVMIDKLLSARLKTGLMTSPHIFDFCERFSACGKTISDSDFIKYTELIKPEIERIDATLPKDVCISPMGIQADMALAFFNDKETDFNVFECGKGAKFDDVNNIPHEYAVINTIFPEHLRELGDSLEEIADDKSHVITGGQNCVFVGAQEESVLKVLLGRADRLKTPVKIYGKDFEAKNIRFTNGGMLFDAYIGKRKIEDILLPLLGNHQACNCALALAVSLEIIPDLRDEEIRLSLSGVRRLGRMEILSKKPFVLLDACINSKSAENVNQVLNELGIKKATVIIGIPDDKDYLSVAESMKDLCDKIILTRSQNPHYVFSEKQKETLEASGIDCIFTESISDAFSLAKEKPLPIVILGTTSVVAEVEALKNEICAG